VARIIVLMGAPGAGKGTQGRLLCEHLGWPQISTGDILRGMAKEGTPLGHQIRDVLASGALVSDDILAEVVRQRTSREDCKQGYILDGYPRNLNQAQWLDLWAAEQGNEILPVYVAVPFDDIIKRLSGRRTCKNCGEIYNIYLKPPKVEGVCDVCRGELAYRSDDAPETIKRRLEVFEEATAPIVDYYKKTGRFIEVDGRQNVENVFEDMLEAINRAPSSTSSV